MRFATLVPLAALAAVLGWSCGGGGDCPPLDARGDGMAVTVTHEDGCGGATWMAMVTFDGGRTQTVAGDRDGMVTGVLLGDYSGDGQADLVITAEAGRVFGFVRQGNILFGQELPAPPTDGMAILADGQLQVGAAVWDPAAATWRIN